MSNDWYKHFSLISPFIAIIFAVSIFFYPIWLEGKVPIPADLVVGGYYPWIDYKWFGYEAGIPVKNVLMSDVVSVIYPQRKLAFDLIKQGTLPLWNEYMFSGYPLIATIQSAVFYPFNFLYFLFPFVDAWTILVVLQPLLAAVFMYLFLKGLKLSKIAALFGAFAYAFGGYNLIWLEWNIHVHASAVIPGILLVINKFLETKQIRFLFFLTILYSLQILAGYPQTTFYTLIITAFWLGIKLQIYRFTKQKIKLAGLIVFFIFLSALISGIQLFPALELYQNSQRVAEVLSIDARFFKFQQLVVLLSPDYYGNTASRNYWGVGDSTHSIGYTGVITVVLAFLSLVHFKKRMEVRFFWLVIIVSLILLVDSFLSRIIFLGILDNLFQGMQASSAVRVLLLVDLSMAVLAAYGIDYLRLESWNRNATKLICVPAGILISILIGTFVSLVFMKMHFASLDSQVIISTLEPWIQRYTIAARNTLVSVFFLFVALFLILLSLKSITLRKNVGVLFIIVLLIELFRYGWKITPFSHKGFIFPSTPVIEFLKNQQQPFRFLGSGVIPENMWVHFELESPDGYDAVYPKAQAKIISLLNNPTSIGSEMGRHARINNYEYSLLDLMNVKYLLGVDKDNRGLSSQRVGTETSRFKPVFEDRSVKIIENKNVLPRSFVVTQWETINNEHTVLTNLISNEYPFNKKVMLSEEFSSFQQSDENLSSVKYINNKSQDKLIEVESKNPGLLFIADTWYPGWKAKVDGENVKILKANYAFRAIPIDKGRHLVQMYYQPNSFNIGRNVSIFGVVVLILVTLLLRIKLIRI